MALSKNGTLTSDGSLVLRCREINDIARHASELVRHELQAVADAAQIYTFKQRLKPAGSILEKILRKRAEGEALRHQQDNFLRSTDKEKEKEREAILKRIDELKSYGPDHVTDAWGCRFVTLFQDQIPVVVRAIVTRLEEFNKSSAGKVTLKEFVIYTSQPLNSPLSIAAPTLTVMQESGLASSVVIDEKAIRPPENKKSAYSSVHMIFTAPLIIEHPGRGGINETAQFEIQVRDIFEEGWGEIEHFLVYSVRERLAEGSDEPRSWHSFLNALKVAVDGCSSSATSINRAAQADGRTKMPTLDTTSATHREADRMAVLAALRSKVAENTLQLVDTAYANLIAAEGADTRDEAIPKLVATAALFEQAIVAVGEKAIIKVSDRDNRPVEYFLRMELANCYLYGGMLHNLDEAIGIYESMEKRFPADPIPCIRNAKALVMQDPIRGNFLKANEILRGALKLIQDDALTGPGHWMQMSALIQLGWNHWKISRDYAKAENWAEQLNHLREAVRVTLDAYVFWTRLDRKYPDTDTHRLFAHKALSNVVYYGARIREISADDAQATPALIRQWIDQLGTIAVPLYRDYYKTQDNLMQAHASIGEIDAARDLANKIFDHLKKTAERRAGRSLKFDDIPNHLEGEDEKAPFMSAVGIKLGSTLS